MLRGEKTDKRTQFRCKRRAGQGLWNGFVFGSAEAGHADGVAQLERRKRPESDSNRRITDLQSAPLVHLGIRPAREKLLARSLVFKTEASESGEFLVTNRLLQVSLPVWAVPITDAMPNIVPIKSIRAALG